MKRAPESIAAVPPSTPESLRTALGAALDAWIGAFGPRLISLVLFGSVARGTATGDSDIDLLAVIEPLPRSLRDRRNLLLSEWARVPAAATLPPIEWNLVVKTPDEARGHSPMYLDLVEDAILLVDRGGFFAAVLAAMRRRMRELGSRRVFLPDGSWYWDLKPDFRFGENVEI